MSDLADKIIVVIRKRPLGKKELAKKDEDIVDVQADQSVIVKELKQKVDLTKYVEEHMFNFDQAFDQNATNQEVYLSAVRPIIEAAFNRARVTCFAYGQTGSGKTHTMLGDIEKQIPGMYILAAYDIFQLLQQPEFQQLSVGVSFFEIYCGKLFDLLNQRGPIQVREDAKGNVNLINLLEKKVTSVQQLMQIISQGQNVRVTAQNGANNESSRSHAILQINLKIGKNTVHGKLSFIDLAGSERGADVQDSNKQTRIDGAEINKSLLALKECIRALDLNKNHTPFRGSKLTLVLKDSLTGNCKTVMIGNISPSSSSSEHTLNTLRYADRVKELKKPQDKQFQGDYIQRELMLARQNTNVVRKAYKNPDDDDDESSYTESNSTSNAGFPQQQCQNSYSNLFGQQQPQINQSYQSNQYSQLFQQQQQQQPQFQQPQQQYQQPQYQQYQQPQFQQQQYQYQQPIQPQQQQQSKSQFLAKNNSAPISNQQGNILNRFNLGSIPTINGGVQSTIFPPNQRQYTQQPYQQQQPLIPEYPQFQQQRYQNNLFQEQQQPEFQQEQIVEEEMGMNSPQFYNMRQSVESQISNRSKPLMEINNFEGQKYFNKPNEFQYCQLILSEHKQAIDKIVEITKDEMKHLQSVQSTQDMAQYLQKVIYFLEEKSDLTSTLHQKMKQYQKELNTKQTFQPNQHTFHLFQQEDNLLNIDDNMI